MKVEPLWKFFNRAHFDKGTSFDVGLDREELEEIFGKEFVERGA